MGKSTPGPWEKAPRRGGGLGGVVNGCGKAVAVTAHQDDEAEFEANARLIAASPMMKHTIVAALDALDEAAFHLVRAPQSDQVVEGLGDLDAARAMLRAAIARTEATDTGEEG